MKKILLTSTGFDNDNIMNKFKSLLDVDAKDAKVLFITTAANDPDAVRILSGCLDDLTKCGVPDENITVYDMHKLLSQDEINRFDAIYVCGGSTRYLVERIHELNAKPLFDNFVDKGGVYVGVSAGSVCASGKYPNGLALLDNVLDVHCAEGSPNGSIDTTGEINLTDNQAIFIGDDEKVIFE